jgi:formiminotetrahydrofolate cyclodeaminase
MFKNLSIAEFSEQLAQAESGVGGGSAAALTGMLAVNLLQMAITSSLTLLGEDKKLLPEKNQRLLFLEGELAKLMDEDAAALKKLIACAALSGNATDESPFADNMEKNLENAARIPLKTAACCQEALAIAIAILPISEHNLKSELMAAAANAHAGATGALMSVAVNLGYLKNEDLISELKATIKNTKSAIDALKKQGEDLIFCDYPFSVFIN